MIRIIHANFGVSRINSLRAMAASVKHEYYASFTICCHLKRLFLVEKNVFSLDEGCLVHVIWMPHIIIQLRSCE